MTFRRADLKHLANRAFAWGALAVVVALGLVVAGLGLYLRAQLRAQILSRDALLMEAVVMLETSDTHPDGYDAGWQALDHALVASELRGVIGLTLSDAQGRDVESVPYGFAWPGAGPALRARALEAGPQAGFHLEVPLELLFDDAVPGSESLPMVDIVVVLEDDEGAGPLFAHYWIEGTSVAEEFALLDRRLLLQGLLAWLAASAAIGGVFRVSFARLKRAGLDLAARTDALEAANRELELAARSAAVGSISAHLLHGLSSPLAGLRSYLRAQGDADAMATAQRMQTLVHETLQVLRTERSLDPHGDTVPLAEIVEELTPGFAADTCRLTVEDLPPATTVAARQANLLRLVLANLIANAVEAAPGQAEIALRFRLEGETLACRVCDRSGGIPAAVRERLFEPGASTKEGGTGLGLAISRQLVRALRGELRLEHSDSTGSSFLMTIPLEMEDFR